MLNLLKNFSKLPHAKTQFKNSNLFENCINSFPKWARFNSSSNALKVTVVGAAGRTGKPLSLMLKQNPLIDELCLYDIKPTCTFAKELSHIDTRCKVTAFSGDKELQNALQHSNIVVIVAACPNSSHLRYDEMFEMNVPTMKFLADEITRFCPKALIAIGTHPINSLVPMVHKILSQNITFNSGSLFGITTLDVVRTNTFVAETLGLAPECVNVPVIGGAQEKTIVPILSQAKPCAEFNNEEVAKITAAVQEANKDIVKIKGNEAATLAEAFATARFVISLVKGVKGFPNIVECAYVYSTATDFIQFLSTPLQLGPNGIMKNLGPPAMNEYEHCLLDNAVIHLIKHIDEGIIASGIKDESKELPCDPCDPDPASPPCPPDWCEKEKERERKQQ